MLTVVRQRIKIYIYTCGACREGGEVGVKDEPRRGPKTCAVGK
jgi:hypothetical protein